MTDYWRAKKQFLEWLQGQGEHRGYSPEVNYGAKVILERPRLLARTRASVAQRRKLKFKVNDEVEYENDEFEKVYSIILDLHDGRTWDAEQDSFYPLSLRLIDNISDNKDINGDYPVTVDLSHPGVKRQKNRLQTLFPVEEEEDQEPPAERITDDRTKELNDIAKNL
ncbi:hypothetical protein [Haloarcula litorea]|uniref:hypothetical protein n=1 Tax=Haloarcula litorea TaxID=3032579 RepID=UPI0023E7AEC1|nr:hypothetical protein [Halomicroarcula sp. GDY20]